MKTCRTCLAELSAEEFPKRSSMCRPCHNAYTREHYQNNKATYAEKARRNSAVAIERNRAFVIMYKTEHPCVDCGNPDIEVLQFDHKDQSGKVAEISTMLAGSQEKLVQEIEKCEVRCANCHVRRTRRQLGQWNVAPLGEFIIGRTVLVPDEYVERLEQWRRDHNFNAIFIL